MISCHLLRKGGCVVWVGQDVHREEERVEEQCPELKKFHLQEVLSSGCWAGHMYVSYPDFRLFSWPPPPQLPTSFSPGGAGEGWLGGTRLVRRRADDHPTQDPMSLAGGGGRRWDAWLESRQDAGRRGGDSIQERSINVACTTHLEPATLVWPMLTHDQHLVCFYLTATFAVPWWLLWFLDYLTCSRQSSQAGVHLAEVHLARLTSSAFLGQWYLTTSEMKWK